MKRIESKYGYPRAPSIFGARPEQTRTLDARFDNTTSNQVFRTIDDFLKTQPINQSIIDKNTRSRTLMNTLQATDNRTKNLTGFARNIKRLCK